MKQLYNEKEMLMTSNRSLAEYNLSQEPVLASKRDDMAEKHREAVELIAQLKNTKDQLEAKSGKVKPDVLYSLLQVFKFDPICDTFFQYCLLLPSFRLLILRPRRKVRS